jgi:hypothetical protein
MTVVTFMRTSGGYDAETSVKTSTKGISVAGIVPLVSSLESKPGVRLVTDSKVMYSRKAAPQVVNNP